VASARNSFIHDAVADRNPPAAFRAKTQVTFMKSIFLPAFGLAAALALSPIVGVSAADAAPVQKHHVVHHPKKKVVHHESHKTTLHAKKKVVHHPKLVHHKKGVHGVPSKTH
jgi:hypothetical protein